nr:reverse transcriptase domain-containing protein [Tanacetum cinerariifolium]
MIANPKSDLKAITTRSGVSYDGPQIPPSSLLKVVENEPELDTFYNALNSKDQDSLNSAAGGNFRDKMPRECLAIIESKSKVCYSRDKPVVAKVNTNASTSGVSPDVAELKDMVKALLLDKKGQNQSLAPMKAVKRVVLLAVVLILTVIIQPPMATIIVITSKNLYLKPSQLTTTKEIPAIVLQ